MALPDDLWRECAAWLTRCKIIPGDHRLIAQFNFFCFRHWMIQAKKKLSSPFYHSRPGLIGVIRRLKYWRLRFEMECCCAISYTSLILPWSRRNSIDGQEMHRYDIVVAFRICWNSGWKIFGTRIYFICSRNVDLHRFDSNLFSFLCSSSCACKTSERFWSAAEPIFRSEKRTYSRHRCSTI